MKLLKRKKQILTKLSTLGTMLTLFAIKSNLVFATGIGTAELIILKELLQVLLCHLVVYLSLQVLWLQQ